MKRYSCLFIAVALLGLLTASCSCPNIFGKAPDFILNTLDGTTVSLSDYLGKNVVLNFWATWCDYCKAELPLLQTANEKDSTPDLVFMTVDIGEDVNQVKNYVTSTNMTLTVLLDQDQDVATKYCIHALPLTLFINKKGIIIDNKLGAFHDQSEIETHLKSFQ